MAKEKIFYVYVDWTREKIPRAFYVGKGNDRRITDFSDRNNHWRSIRDKYGCNRITLIGTKEESFSFELEKEMIIFHKTYKAMWTDGSGWGANFTNGGEGASGRTRDVMSSEERARRSFASTGKKHSVETKKKKRVSMLLYHGLDPNTPKIEPIIRTQGLTRSEWMSGNGNHQFGKTGPLSPNYGKTGEQSWMFGKTQELSPTWGRKRPIEELKFGEANHSAKLTTDNIIAIRKMFLDGKTDNEISALFNVKRKAINDIRNRKTWKHIP